jgi:branched-subunit amino acid ABC-type transport system permease component
VTPATLLIWLPIALDGEAASGNNTAIGVISVVSIACGYVLLAALWYFVFREKAGEKRKKRSPPD